MNDRKKGSLYVYLQFSIMAAAVASAYFEFRLMGYVRNPMLIITGSALALVGFSLLILSARSFKQKITPHPIPLNEYTLQTTGMYKAVRHPIYFTATLLFAGIIMAMQGYMSFVWVIILFILFNSKASFEERFLREKFPDYSDYIKRTRKLIPYIY